MPRGIPNVATKTGFFVCTEAFSVTVGGEDLWFRAGQRVHENHRVFEGESGENRKQRLFIPEDEAPEYGERLRGREVTA